jgi:PAS domain S-box-containing protein
MPPYGATFVGGAAKSLLGYETQQFLEEPDFWIQHIHPGDACEVTHALPELIQRGEGVIRYRFQRRDGMYRWLRDDLRLIKDDSGIPDEVVGCCIDITEHRKAEEVLIQTRRSLAGQMRQMEKLVEERTSALTEAVGELDAISYSIAHDMRAPLRSMSGFSGMLLERYRGKLDTEGIELLERICRSSKRLDRLIQDVLDYGRILGQQVTIESVDLDRLVRDMIETYPEWRPPRADVEVEGTLPAVLGNEALLTQCVSNLLGNAVKFVAHGVHPRVVVAADQCGTRIRLNVRDNGIGIAPEQHDRVFRMFEHIHPGTEYEGTGIGLTIARKVVEQMGGRIGFDSELGRGSRFWIELEKG